MENTQNELARYGKMLYRRRRLFLIVSILAMSCLIGYSFLLPKKYSAKSTVFIEKSVINNLVKGLAITPDMEDRIKVLKYALLSRGLITKVVEDMEPEALKGKNIQNIQGLVGYLQKNTEIGIQGDELFTVSIVDQSPRFAQNYVNTLVMKYVEGNLEDKRQESYGANRFLDEQLSLFKNRLDETEDAIIDFRKKNNIYLSVDENSIIEEIKQYQTNFDSINLELETLKAKKRRLASQLKTIDPSVAIFTENQKGSKIAILEERIRQLLVTYTENYPEVVQLQAEVLALKKEGPSEQKENRAFGEMKTLNPVYQEIQQKALETESEISALEAKKNMVLQRIAEREKDLRDIPESKKKLGVLVQQRDSARKIYDELLMRRGQSEVSKQMEIGDKTTNFRVVDPAFLPIHPVSPNMFKMILLAIAGGLGGALGLVLLLENLDSSVRDIGQLQELNVQVLAIIPRIPDQKLELIEKRRDLLVYSTASFFYICAFGLLAYEGMKTFGLI